MGAYRRRGLPSRGPTVTGACRQPSGGHTGTCVLFTYSLALWRTNLNCFSPPDFLAAMWWTHRGMRVVQLQPGIVEDYSQLL